MGAGAVGRCAAHRTSYLYPPYPRCGRGQGEGEQRVAKVHKRESKPRMRVRVAVRQGSWLLDSSVITMMSSFEQELAPGDQAHTAHADQVFAPLDRDLVMERIGGGNETEVYWTDDRRYVVKLKCDLGGTAAEALAHARQMRAAAESFAECLGAEHSIPTYYVVARDSAGSAQVLAIQPFLAGAKPLFDVRYRDLEEHERESIARQLREIIRRSLSFYRETGRMPDVYGRTSASSAERRRLNTLLMLPWRMWSFLVQRNLLRSHNLMLTAERRVVLVDYDFVRKSRLYLLIYYTVRWMLFWRDHFLIMWMRRGQAVPRDSCSAEHND